MQVMIVAQEPDIVTTEPETPPTNVLRIAYRPKGRHHPEQWVAVFEGERKTAVTPESADRIIRMARDFGLYDGLHRHPWAVRMPEDNGRQWWAYKLLPNELGRFLEEVPQ